MVNHLDLPQVLVTGLSPTPVGGSHPVDRPLPPAGMSTSSPTAISPMVVQPVGVAIFVYPASYQNSLVLQANLYPTQPTTPRAPQERRV